ncbi:hypothetical protein C8A00DRAFT_18843, partial [Chaetomidium leptoderma]
SDPLNNRYVELNELESTELNVCCPVKLILIWALRIGAVAETSWDDLVANARLRPSKRVVWTRPELPLLCSMKKGKGQVFDYATPASQWSGPG